VVKDGMATDAGRGVAQLLSSYRDGGTLVLQGLHTYWPALTEFTNFLAHELSASFQVNAYLTPSTSRVARGLRPHFDTHDVFVLQLRGRKHWRIFEPATKLPLKDQAFDEAPKHLGRARHEFALSPGDCVYIPRGFYHDAAVKRSPCSSLHLTVGVFPTTWKDLLESIVAQAAARDVRLRESLPLGLGFDAASRSRLRKRVARLFTSLPTERGLKTALAQVLERIQESQRPVVDGHLVDLERLPRIHLSTPLWKRNLPFWIRPAKETVALHFAGKVVRMPWFVKPALHAMRRRDRFTAEDLGSEIDAEGRILLVRTLVHEGFLTLRCPSGMAHNSARGPRSRKLEG
jgi:hypothetical protein